MKTHDFLEQNREALMELATKAHAKLCSNVQLLRDDVNKGVVAVVDAWHRASEMADLAEEIEIMLRHLARISDSESELDHSDVPF